MEVCVTCQRDPNLERPASFAGDRARIRSGLMIDRGRQGNAGELARRIGCADKDLVAALVEHIDRRSDQRVARRIIGIDRQLPAEGNIAR